jgi:hypothetical protein
MHMGFLEKPGEQSSNSSFEFLFRPAQRRDEKEYLRW